MSSLKILKLIQKIFAGLGNDAQYVGVVGSWKIRFLRQQQKEIMLVLVRNESLSFKEFFERYPTLVTHRARKKDIEIIISPYPQKCMSYNAIKEYIALPNDEGTEIDLEGYDRIFIDYFSETLTHETIHRLIHLMIGLRTCVEWDNIDRFKVDYGGYLLSSI